MDGISTPIPSTPPWPKITSRFKEIWKINLSLSGHALAVTLGVPLLKGRKVGRNWDSLAVSLLSQRKEETGHTAVTRELLMKEGRVEVR